MQFLRRNPRSVATATAFLTVSGESLRRSEGSIKNVNVPVSWQSGVDALRAAAQFSSIVPKTAHAGDATSPSKSLPVNPSPFTAATFESAHASDAAPPSKAHSGDTLLCAATAFESAHPENATSPSESLPVNPSPFAATAFESAHTGDTALHSKAHSGDTLPFAATAFESANLENATSFPEAEREPMCAIEKAFSSLRARRKAFSTSSGSEELVSLTSPTIVSIVFLDVFTTMIIPIFPRPHFAGCNNT